MADDGNRQVALTLGDVQVGVTAGLDPTQFEALDLKLGGIHGAVDKLAENVSDPETNVAAQVTILAGEVQALREAVTTGATDLRQSLAELNSTIIDSSNNIGKWLAAIALAAANPDDNSAEVQRQIDAATAQLQSSTDALDSAVKANQPK